MKICLAASTGGHLTQLLRLRDAWQDQAHFFVTPAVPVPAGAAGTAPTYVICQANREHPFRLVRMIAQCGWILLKERPHVIISTGAAVGCILCLLAKLAGKRIVWVDTVSHVDCLTLSGRIIRPFADLFLVQWPDLAERYKGVKYVGAVL